MELKSQVSGKDALKKRLSSLSLNELIEKAEAKEALLEQDRQEAAKFYTPNGKVEEFIKLFGEDKTFISLFIGGNGTGKTSAGANIVANICYGVQNKFFDYPLFKKFPYLKRGRIISDPTTIKEKIIPELKKWLPGSYSEQLPEATFTTAKEGKNFEAKFITPSVRLASTEVFSLMHFS